MTLREMLRGTRGVTQRSMFRHSTAGHVIFQPPGSHRCRCARFSESHLSLICYPMNAIWRHFLDLSARGALVNCYGNPPALPTTTDHVYTIHLGIIPEQWMTPWDVECRCKSLMLVFEYGLIQVSRHYLYLTRRLGQAICVAGGGSYCITWRQACLVDLTIVIYGQEDIDKSARSLISMRMVPISGLYYM